MTLLELLMVVVVLGILGAVAIANYRRTVERGYCRVAQDMLETIYHGERAYYFTHDNKYFPMTGQRNAPSNGQLDENSHRDAWGEIFMDNPHLKPSIPVTFTVTVTAPGATFTATATRDGTGSCPATGSSCAGCTLTIDQERAFSGTWLGNPNCCGT